MTAEPALGSEAVFGGARVETRSGARARRAIVATAYRPRDYLLRRALAAADLLGVLGATALLVAVSQIRIGWAEAAAFGAMLPAWLVLFRLYGLYERDVKRVSLSLLDDLPALFHACLVGTLVLWAWLHLLDVGGLSFAGAAGFGLAALVSVSGSRLAARRAFLRLKGPARVLLVGESPLSGILVRKMRDHRRYGLDPVGEVTLSHASGAPIPDLGRLGEVDLRELASRHRIDRVLVASPDVPDRLMMDLVSACGTASVKVSILPRHVDALGPSLEVDDIEGLTMLGLNPLVLPRTSRMLKRALDVGGATLGLLLLAPLLLAGALAVKLDTPGPVLFRQRRIGRGGRAFTLIKLRTMIVGAEERAAGLRAASADPDWLKLERDPRITRSGRFLRRSSLDELPQLWNVLRGEMSLVGPRPLIDLEDEQVRGWARTRLDLAPGVTGMWQVLGRTDIPFREMLQLDCLYVTNWSLWLDVKLIARTIPAVFTRRGTN